MDISVSQLNNRLALQLPSELPLGLVFVAGKVGDLVYEGVSGDNGRRPPAQFNLEQGIHSLRCNLRLREGEDITFNDGAQIRVGGHLAFDTRRLQYYLMARDVEVIGIDDPVLDANGNARELVHGDEALLAALAGIKRRSELAQQNQSELPIWVQKLAPDKPQATVEVEDEFDDSSIRKVLPPLNDEMVHYLSTLMDSEEEVELTPDMLAQWLPEEEATAQNGMAVDTAVAEAQTLELKEWADDLADIDEVPRTTAVNPYDPVADSTPEAAPKSTPKSRSKQVDWLVIIAVVALIIFALALIIAIFVQVVQ